MRNSTVTQRTIRLKRTTYLLVAFAACSSWASASLSDCTSDAVTAKAEHACLRVNAGVDRKIVLSQPAVLDGSATTNRSGEALIFNWRLIEAPRNSQVAPSSRHAVRTSFVPDQAGDYVFELYVTDSLGTRARDVVRYSTNSLPPVAVISPTVKYAVGDTLTLNGESSFDADGDLLNFDWRIEQQPLASRTFFTASKTASPSLTLDVPGQYTVSLGVDDSLNNSERVTLELSTQSPPPLADAGKPRTLVQGSTLLLDGSNSQAADKSNMTYTWSILSAPQGNTTKPSDSAHLAPRLVADVPGQYLIQLIVNDGLQQSLPDTVLYEVIDRPQATSTVRSGAASQTLGQSDTDLDGVIDLEDNCLLVANPAQRDTDGDGYGNFCDTDLNNDGITNFLDLFIWQQSFLTSDPHADFDGSGSVNFIDGAIFNLYYLQSPGPVGAVRWSSPVDGDWSEPLNWTPRLVPDESVIAVIDVAEDVTVSLVETVAIVKGLIVNNSLLIEDGTLEAIDLVELGGQIQGSMTRFNNTTFSPSLMGSGNLVIDAGPHVWQGTTLNVDTVIDTGATLFNSGGLTINQTLTIDSHWFATHINFTDTQLVDGVGTLVLDGWGNPVNPAINLTPASQTTTTFGPQLEIRGGRAVIGSGDGGINIMGDVVSDIEGEVLTIGGSTWAASGSMLATDNATIVFFGNLENSGATMNIDGAGGQFTVSAEADLSSGNITATPGVVLTVQGGSSTWRDMELNLDVLLENGARINVRDDFTMNGTATIRSTSSSTGLTFYSDRVIAGATSFVFDGADNPETQAYLGAVDVLTLGPDTLVTGTNGILSGFGASAKFVFEGPVEANVPGESISIAGGSFSGNGQLSASNGGTLLVGAGIDSAGSPVSFDGASGQIVFLPGAYIKNTVINGTPGTVLEFTMGSTNGIENVAINTDVLVSNSRISINGDLELNGTLTLGDTSTADSVLQFFGTQTLTGDATIVLEGSDIPSSFKSKITGINMSGQAPNLTVPQTAVIRGGGGTIGEGINTLVIEGELIVDSGPILIPSTNLSISSLGSVSIINEQVLSTWNLSSANGSIHLGAGSTFLAIPSDPLTMNSQTSFDIEISSPSKIGQMLSNENVEYNGQLTIHLLNGYSPQVGDSFELFTHGSFSGGFNSILTEGAGPDESFELTYSPTGVTATLAN